jgi:sigma-B regulation protein RsbU (phosphoserine phosphatase)
MKMARIPRKLNMNSFSPDNFMLPDAPALQRYNAYRLVTYSPLTLNQSVRVAAFSEPSRVVGGDFYEVFQLDQHRMGILIADVCGKGLVAARMVLQIQELLKQQTDTNAPIPLILQRVNDQIEDFVISGKFVTLFYGILNTETGELQYANAGHNLPVVLHNDNSFTWLKSTGPGLGIIPGANFDLERRYLRQNDLIIFYTDGITDVFNDYSEIYGEDRMIACLRKHRWYAPETIIEALIRDIQSFSSSVTLPDDRTVILLKLE